jgi:hypothetical protein
MWIRIPWIRNQTASWILIRSFVITDPVPGSSSGSESGSLLFVQEGRNLDKSAIFYHILWFNNSFDNILFSNGHKNVQVGSGIRIRNSGIPIQINIYGSTTPRLRFP